MLQQIKEYIGKKRLNTQAQKLKDLFPTMSNKKIKKLDRELKDKINLLSQKTIEGIPDDIIKDIVGDFIIVDKKDKNGKRIRKINDIYSENNLSLMVQDNSSSAAFSICSFIRSLIVLIIPVEAELDMRINVLYLLSVLLLSMFIQKMHNRSEKMQLAVYILNTRGVGASVLLMLFEGIFDVLKVENTYVNPTFEKICIISIMCLCIEVMFKDYKRKIKILNEDKYEARLYKK